MKTYALDVVVTCICSTHTCFRLFDLDIVVSAFACSILKLGTWGAGIRVMAPQLKLPNNFRVKTLWSSCNNCGVGNLLPPTVGGGAGIVASAPIEIDCGAKEEVILISETRLPNSLSILLQFPSLSESIVVSPETKGVPT